MTTLTVIFRDCQRHCDCIGISRMVETSGLFELIMLCRAVLDLFMIDMRIDISGLFEAIFWPVKVYPGFL